MNRMDFLLALGLFLPAFSPFVPSAWCEHPIPPPAVLPVVTPTIWVSADGSGNLQLTAVGIGIIRKMAGEVPGTAGATQIDNPSQTKGLDVLFKLVPGMTVDHAGNIYFSDPNKNVIREITQDGEKILAGSAGVTGSSDGKGSAASFHNPKGLAVDKDGTVLVADSGNHLIRKISPDGTVTTLAGSAGVTGASDGIGTAALFSNPSAVVLDASGNAYVADSDNFTIRKITPRGAVSTLAMSGTSGNSSYFGPELKIAVDEIGNVYVVNEESRIVLQLSPQGAPTTLAGSDDTGDYTIMSYDGKGTDASFSGFYAITTDDEGNVYVVDTEKNLIRKIDPKGLVQTLSEDGSWGTYDGGYHFFLTPLVNPVSLGTDSSRNYFVTIDKKRLTHPLGKRPKSLH